MHALLDVQRTWTFEELQEALPEDADWRRYEIVDGALVVSPSADLEHEFVIDEVRRIVRRQLPDELWIGGPVTVDLRPSYRIPDLVVVHRSLVRERRRLVLPSELVLAVEVVSPGSQTTDRVTKPAQYAAAGIRGYWRVEREPAVQFTAYALTEGAKVYAELGTWSPGQVADIDEPLRLHVPVDELIP